ncbi:alkane oxidation protein activator PraA [Rhodococcus sp. P1Y]|uniref:alkane oxidation protein activator PraA n=1 Tax=Rhodococcus sp. P1Y TaxID=1302308 RepID=UPI000EB33B3E|nr:alkane oxidation protein activator PraA [Rhodococcus sp. P1Y]AYJ51645.1 protein activator [Rhodococcus sp. P1Y]
MTLNLPSRSRTLATIAAAVAVAGATLGAGSASAATISPANTAFTAPGTIVVTTPASFGLPVTCSISLSGSTSADGSSAAITAAQISGSNRLCGLPQLKNLPWTLTPTSATTGEVSNVGFSLLGYNCGPATLAGTFDNMTNTLTSTNQPMSGNCTINSLSVQPDPAFTLS